MIVPALLMIALGLYGLVFSERISERARREKWAFGGNRVFTLIASFMFLGMGSLFLQSVIEQSLDDSRSGPSGGWAWFWFIGGFGMLLGGVYFIVRSRNVAENFRRLRSSQSFPIAYPNTSRKVAVHGVVYVLWGLSWTLGSWPF